LGKGALGKSSSPRWGDSNNDLQPISKGALIGAIKKCRQTIWAGGKFSPPAARLIWHHQSEDRQNTLRCLFRQLQYSVVTNQR
jgi:hypothetical protein